MTGNTSFAQLKRADKNSIEKLSEAASKLGGKKQVVYEEDTRFWSPTVDKAGNGSAVIRFLPAPQGEDVPFVMLFKHNFKGPTGKYYIENSLTTIGKVDPVGELNKRLWDTGLESNKKIARDQKRNQVYISNIYVVEDPAKPENKGKVFLYKYGKKIFDKLNDAMHPADESEEAMNPFSLFTGANFKLKIKNVLVDMNGQKVPFRNYDNSHFLPQSELLDDEDEMETLWKNCHSLEAFIDPKNFKSYEQLKARLDAVLGNHTEGYETSTPRDENSANPNWDNREDEDDEPVIKKVVKKTVAEEEDETPPFDTDDSEDSDEEISFFRNLAKKK